MLRRASTWAAVAGLVILLDSFSAARAWGQASADQATLAAAARQAAGQFQAVTPQAAEQAKADLARAVSQLDRFLSTSPQKAIGWKRYLQWNDLLAVLQNGAAGAEQASLLASKLRANKTGLEMPQFTAVHDALTRYAEAAQASANMQLADEYARRMQDLAGHLEAYQQNPAAGDAALAIGRTVGWLERHGQAPALVADVRRAYGQPNLFGSASQRFAAVGVEENVDQVTGVRDNILGTDLYGTARLIGQTSLVLNENPTAASLSILLNGTAYSNTVGYNGPVTIYSTGATSVSGHKPLAMTAEGLIGYRASAACRTQSNINAICANRAFIERIAWKRAGQQKGQAEQIASQHAAARVAGQMDGQAGSQIAEQNARYLDKFVRPLQRRGEFPELLGFSTRPDRLQVRMLKAGDDLLAAPGPPPETAAAHDLALTAHESLVTNFGEGALGGYELKDVDLEKLLRDDLKTELPDELRVTLADGTLDPEKEPWSITFAKELPVRATFQNGGLRLALRADRFTRGEGDEPGSYRPAITELVEIAAAFTIEKTPQGATLRREGDVQVRFPNRANPDQLTIRDSPIATFIRRKFRNLFKEEFVGEGLVFKGRWEQAGRLRLAEIRSDGAWLTVGWQMPGAATAPAATAAEAE